MHWIFRSKIPLTLKIINNTRLTESILIIYFEIFKMHRQKPDSLTIINEITRKIGRDWDLHNKILIELIQKYPRMHGEISLTYITIRALLEKSHLISSEETLNYVKDLLEEYPDIFELKDKSGNTLLFYVKWLH